MPLDLNGRKVLVVGAAGGIGLATAQLFTRNGARVVAAGRPGTKLNEAARTAEVEAAALDFTDEAAIEAFFGGREPFDHVVVAAATTRTGSVAELPLADARSAMDSKFWGAYRIARSAKIVEGGSLTFVSGYLSQRPGPAAVLQGAINAALDALARGLALERAPVRFNTVSPGLVDTPLYARMDKADRQAMFERRAAQLPARRIGHPDDIAQAILFVATNPYATGSTVTVDGGGTIA
ncbi:MULTISPECIES: SDR family oxidoreductase [unclassified Methylobacterium]|uniref:SDR family oxidoreductase n=1 Tax=unclassified Methylobacterium TaxID=2615210 RepID=UPI0011CCD8A8|nr:MULTISPECIES: SDR family oxidoreductase [unclassified Methylobacterium]MCK2057012.1 SDR family oxidoreductase [Methylobacterium sp. 37f]TXM65936.1 SDR family oxidoreductase [Methylobacterium sp. WL120]TXN14246.1 SDR family oxidoreductase [Methylobacterium sp. WL122]